MATADDYDWFRSRIAERRRAKKWSVNKAAARADMAPKTWSNTEKGTYQVTPGVSVPHTPDPATVAKIATVLGIVDEVNARFGEQITEAVRSPVKEQLRELKAIVLDVVRRMDEIEDQIDP